MNLFNYKRVAAGYANDRPSYHRAIIEKIRKELQLRKNLDCGLDVGCGSGASTIALKDICDKVIGIEESEEMLCVAETKYQDPGLRFLHCKAEDSPFDDHSFDVVTASGSVNWIDPRVFLPLMSRQIKTDGWLIIYDNYISSRIADSKSFVTWYNNAFLTMFPRPPRNEEAWDDVLLKPYGFSVVKQENFQNTVTMNQNEFTRFMITQSNVISAVEQGNQSLEGVNDWLNRTLEAIFGGHHQELRFEGYIWYAKKVSSPHSQKGETADLNA